MSEGNGEWHFLHVADYAEVGVGPTLTWLHPESCPVSLRFEPRMVDTGGRVLNEHDHHVQTPACGIAWEVGETGPPEDVTSDGWWAVRTWFAVMPGGPWGPTDYDGGYEVLTLAEFLESKSSAS